jgi:hypothetical protein
MLYATKKAEESVKLVSGNRKSELRLIKVVNLHINSQNLFSH